MKINPETLVEEGDDERKDRQARTGVMKNGLNVICFPNPEEPLVYETHNRVSCLTKPYPTCSYCRHSVFTLFFDESAPQERYRMVSCPRWSKAGDRELGAQPDSYALVEHAACEKRELDFCPSCPSQEELVQISTDKSKEGWYSRWHRHRKEEFSDE